MGRLKTTPRTLSIFACVFLFFALAVPSRSARRRTLGETIFKTASSNGQARPLCESTLISELQPWNAHKKVIAFSLFAASDDREQAEFPWFLGGLERNARDAALYYPDWIVRVYATGLSVEDEAKLLRHNSVEIVRCFVDSPLKSSSSRKMLTRFLVADDPNTSYAIVRDADSRFSPREVFAVNEWMSSDAMFHVMRDHAAHDVPVLGGMFGVKRGALGTETMFGIVQRALIENPARIEGAIGEDQAFLKRYVWPKLKGSAMAHDTDKKRCARYGSRFCLDFPFGARDENAGFYVGASFKSDVLESPDASYECSVKCSLEG